MKGHISMDFPKSFLWGCATSSHQVEGENTNNNWWQWEHIPGKIWHSDKSGYACGWWRSMDEDISFMKQMNNNTHRMSIEWSRIEPEEGEFDEGAINRYKEMISSLKDKGIEPMVTLHHFTNPVWFEDKGAWINKDSVRYFKRYVSFVIERLGKDITLWCTINEPAVYAVETYIMCSAPPGRLSLISYFRSLFNLLDAHMAAYGIIKRDNPTSQVGIVKNYQLFDTWDEGSLWDKLISENLDKYFNSIVLEPFRSGELPFFFPWHREGIKRLKGATDFIGLNYYTRWRVRSKLGSPKVMLDNIFNCTPGAQVSDFIRDNHPYGEIYPEGLYRALKIVSALGKPIYITENGLPDADDSKRPGFLLTHLKQVAKAMKDGMDIRGYYHWSLTDNFEWAEGWALRFGLVDFDHKTGERHMRDSGKLYGDIAAKGRITRDMVEEYAPELLPAYFD